MSKKRVLALGLMLAATSAFAAKETVITTETLPDGTVVSRKVEVREAPSTPPDTSFASADRNGDGRVDRTEAKDMGITSTIFAGMAGKKGYLTPQEYETVMQQ